MELIDFDALVARLAKEDLVSMLDHSDEMTKDQLKKLKEFSQCRIFTAIAYLTREASLKKKQIYVDNLKSYLNGSPTNKVS